MNSPFIRRVKNYDSKKGGVIGWTTGKDLVKSFQFHTGLDSDRMVVLGAVWEKEWGYFGHWKLAGVKKGMVLVDVSSSAAAQELQSRSRQVIKSLNQYFQRPWIKGVSSSFRNTVTTHGQISASAGMTTGHEQLRKTS
jgi:hypothetical protein